MEDHVGQKVAPMNLMRKAGSFPWWYWIGGINLFLLFSTALASYVSFPGNEHFFIGHEMNIATWWSGTCLIALALLTYEFHGTRKNGTGLAWLILSIVFLVLSGDEIGSFHERSGGWSNLWKFAAVGMISFAYSMSMLLRVKETRKPALFILSGFALFGLVAVQERVYMPYAGHRLFEGIMVVVEEGTELLGMFICFLGIVKQRGVRRSQAPLMQVIPNPHLVKHLSHILFAGMCIHSAVSLVVPGLTDIPRRGNPAAWYPSFLFFILFCASIWKNANPAEDNRKNRFYLAIFFLILSAAATGTVGNPYTEFFSNYYSFNLVQLPLIVYFLVKIFGHIQRRDILILILFGVFFLYGYVSMMFGLNVTFPSLEYIVTGIFAYCVSRMFLIEKFPERQTSRALREG